MAYKIVHWELMGRDGAELKKFYGELFDWTLEAVPGFGDYYMTNAEETGLAGAVGQGSEDMPNYHIMYIEVPDIDAHLGRAEAAGATVVVPRTVVPDTVVFAMFTDPAGNLVGLVEPDEASG